MPPTLRVKLLGDFEMTCDGQIVEGFTTPRLQSLVAYLILHRGTPQLRQRLAFTFWPDTSEAQARNNLRQLLHALRHSLPAIDDYLSIDSRALLWRDDTPLWLDVAEVERAIAIRRAASDGAASPHNAAEERILDLYQYDLLPGCYDDWIVPARERLRDQMVSALDMFVQRREARGDYPGAIRCARRLIRLDPLNEDAHRQVMRLSALQGDFSGEMQAYQACVEALHRGLGIEPSVATRDLHAQLQRRGAQRTAEPGDEDHSHTPAPLVATEADPAPAAQAPATASAPATTAVAVATAPALVGRRAEWQLLRSVWQAARDTGPQFALISGEAGIGKSRLAEELARFAASQNATVATTRSYAVEGRLSLAPVIELLRGPALRPRLTRLQPAWLSEVARVLPELLVEHPDLPPYEPIGEFGQRQNFFRALARAVLAAPQPLLLVFDDLQWSDQETLDWLHFLLRFATDARMLIIGVTRAEETPPEHPLHTLLRHARHSAPVTEILLHPLDAAETADLAGRLLDSRLAVPAAMRLFRETEGNPLFVVEAVRAGLGDLIEPADDPADDAWLPYPQAPFLPTGTRNVISDRLAQLSPAAHELAALAATVGRAFSLDILLRASRTDEESVVRALDELWQRKIVREHGAAMYDFSHDKLREVAYAESSPPQRHLAHRRIAQALEELHTDDLDAMSGQIAAHLERGGQPERAAPYYQRAAMVAQRVFAYEDAIRLMLHSLALLDSLPSGPARDRQELALLLSLAPLYRITRGWTAPELERVVERALMLSTVVGDVAQRAETLYGQQSLLVVQARLEQTETVADELRAHLRRTEGTVPPLSEMMLAGAWFHLGRIEAANDAFTRMLASADHPQIAQRLQDAQGWNFAVHTRAWQAHALWSLGYPDRALQLADEAVRLAHSLEQPFNRTLAATYQATLSLMSGIYTAAKAQAEEARAISVEYKAPYYYVWSSILIRYAEAREYPDEAHIGALRAAIDEFRATGARLRLPFYLALLADAWAGLGHLDEALVTVTGALAQSDEANERWWEPELYRLRGVYLHASGADRAQVEAALTRAREVAHSQRSRSLELRAWLAAADVSAPEPPSTEIIQATRRLYASLGEGFHTPDLQAAHTLLAQWG